MFKKRKSYNTHSCICRMNINHHVSRIKHLHLLTISSFTVSSTCLFFLFSILIPSIFLVKYFKCVQEFYMENVNRNGKKVTDICKDGNLKVVFDLLINHNSTKCL